MKKLLCIILLNICPMLVYGQKRTVSDLGYEVIQYSSVAQYEYNGNPFENNEEYLILQFVPKFNKEYDFENGEFDWCVQMATFMIVLSKSDLNPLNIEFYPTHHDNTEPISKQISFNEYIWGNSKKIGELKEFHPFYRIFNKDKTWGQEITYEMIFDDDTSTYYKLDSYSVPEIQTIENEFFQKLRTHKKVIIRLTVQTFDYLDGERVLIVDPKRKEYNMTCDFAINLSGIDEAFIKFEGYKSPSLKNKSDYKVVSGLANTNPFNLDKYIDKFLIDAKNNHNIDLSFVNQKERLILFREIDEETIAVALRMGNDEEVFVVVDPENWYQANQAKRWYIIYHELGHDILNLEHGEGGKMMDERVSGEYTWERLEKDKAVMFEYYKENK